MNIDSVLWSEKTLTWENSAKILYFGIKRVFDIFVGIMGIMMLIPLMIVVKLVAVLNRDYDSIFFRQQRIGKDGKLFTMYKFRTMVMDADKVLFELMEKDAKVREEYNINKKLKNDPRITKIGKILRISSLDEFPQFINVLLGDMSLVGNRPYLPREKEDMGVYYKHIVATKPGITGLWQTSGRNNVTFHDRLVIEKKYNMMYSLMLDIKIIFRTVIQTIKKDGAL